MKKIIDADAARLAGLQIDLLQKVRSGQITIEQLERFSNLSSANRDMLFSEGKRKRSALDDTTLSRLKASGYLYTSFDGEEVRSLAIRPLTKEQALDEYKNSGGEASIWNELKKNVPYSVPRTETLDVMILNFDKDIGSNEALAEMDKLGVRPLTYEELIQYGIAYPEHQTYKSLVGLGTKYTLFGIPFAPCLGFVDGRRRLVYYRLDEVWREKWRFLVVRK